MIRLTWPARPYVLGTVTALLLAGATFAAYAPALSEGFVNYDDNTYVYWNPHVLAGLTPDGARWALTTVDAVNWHPLTWLSFMLDQQLYGKTDNPAAGFHLTNVILHVLNTLLLCWTLTRMTGRFGRSVFVAALFALHPLHVESVAWISERKDVLSTLFWMLTTGAYVLYAERPGRVRYLLVVLLFALGLTAKSMLVTLPCVFLLLDFWPLRRLPGLTSVEGAFKPASWTRLVLEKLPLLALAAASSAMTMYAQQQGAQPTPLDQPLPARAANALMSYMIYIEKMFYPAGLVPFYPPPLVKDLFPACLEAGVTLAAVTILVLVAARGAPYLAVGWFWYVGTLVPVIGLAPVIGGQAMADRYTYVPLIGLFMALTWGAAEALNRGGWREWAVAVAGGWLLTGCAAGTWVQCGYWRDSLTLWRHTLDVNPTNYLAYNNIGSELSFKGDVDGAAANFAWSVQCEPNYCLSHYNLGLMRAWQNRPDEALAQYAEAVRLNPKYRDAQYALGWMLAWQGKTAEAVPHLEAAVRLRPEFADAHNDLGRALYVEGDDAGAVAEFEAALRIEPDFASAHANLAEVLRRQGKTEEAARHSAEADRLRR